MVHPVEGTPGGFRGCRGCPGGERRQRRRGADQHRQVGEDQDDGGRFKRQHLYFHFDRCIDRDRHSGHMVNDGQVNADLQEARRSLEAETGKRTTAMTAGSGNLYYRQDTSDGRW